MQTSHDVQNFQVKIQDVYNKLPALIAKFKSYECHLNTMITIALRVLVKHNDIEITDSQGGSFIGQQYFKQPQSKYTIRHSSAQCREILHNFFTTTFGQMEGRIALSTISAFISQIETGQRLPD